MLQIQLNTDCEGPLALNDNAFELCREFIKPHGDRFFTQVSRYGDYLADIAKQPEYQAGDTLKLILPFLKAHGVSNAMIRDFSSQSLRLVPGAEEAYRFLHGFKFPIFEISTSYRQFAEAVGDQAGVRRRAHLLHRAGPGPLPVGPGGSRRTAAPGRGNSGGPGHRIAAGGRGADGSRRTGAGGHRPPGPHLLRASAADGDRRHLPGGQAGGRGGKGQGRGRRPGPNRLHPGGHHLRGRRAAPTSRPWPRCGPAAAWPSPSTATATR